MIGLGDDFFWPSVPLVSSSHLFIVCVARRAQENWIFWEMSSRCLRPRRFVPSVSTCSELIFSFVAFVRDAIAASSFAGAVITWETVSRSGTARTSSTVAALLDVPIGLLCKLIGELTVYTAGVPVVGITEVCNHKVPRVTAPMLQATRLRIVLT